MKRTTAFLLVCLLLLSACGGRGVSQLSPELQTQAVQDLSEQNDKRLYTLYRRSGGRVVIDIAPAAGSTLNFSAARKAMQGDFDALYLLLKAAPSAVVHVEAMSSDAGKARRLAGELGDYIRHGCNLPPSRLQTVGYAAKSNAPATVRLLVAAPRVLQAINLTARPPSAQSTSPDGLHAEENTPSVLPATNPQPQNTALTSQALSTASAGSKNFTLYFNSGRAVLDASMKDEVAILAARLKAEPGLRAHLEGHSDNVGNSENNQLLSYQRALAVQIELITEHGLEADRLIVRGLGEVHPQGSNATQQGRKLNRRVEVRLEPSTQPAQSIAEKTLLQTEPRIPGSSRGMSAPGLAPSTSHSSQSAGNGKHSVARTPLRVSSQPVSSQTRTFADTASPPLTQPAAAASAPAVSRLQEVPLASTSYTSLQHKPLGYRIEVSISKCTLWLYEILADGSKRLVRPFQVATAKPGTPWPKGEGQITGIDFSPWWYPTENMKRRAQRIGKRLVPVPPGSSRNPMGDVKIMLSHMEGGGAYRIHGTNQPWLIGKRVSLGCIRMRNEEGLELARTVPVGTVVDIRY